MQDTPVMEGSAAIVVSVQLTARDLSDLWSGSRVRYLSWLLMPIGLLYAYFTFATIVNDGLTTENTLTLTLYSLIVLMTLLGGFIVSRARARLMIRYGPTLRELRRYSLSDRGVRFDSELMTCDCRWGAFSRVLESQKSFLLYQTPLSAMAIPKRHFSSAEEISQLRVLLRKHFKGKLTLRG